MTAVVVLFGLIPTAYIEFLIIPKHAPVACGSTGGLD